MLTVFYADIDTIFRGDAYSRALAMMPAEIQNRIGRFYHLSDSKLSLLGKLLLLKQLQYHGLHEELPLHLLEADDYGRLSFPASFDFNISHSGKYAICAASTSCRVGVDIEQIRQADFEAFTDYFSTGEWLYINSAVEPLRAFYQLWSRKEAIVKAEGKGISILHEVEVLAEPVEYARQHFHLKDLPVDDQYQSAIAWLGGQGGLLLEAVTFNFDRDEVS